MHASTSCFFSPNKNSQDRHNVCPKAHVYTSENKRSTQHLCESSLKELFLPTGLVNLIPQTRQVIIRIFMLILFSDRKLTPGVTALQNTLCDLAALQALLTYLP